MEINSSSLIMIYKGELSDNFNILNEYNIVIVTEILNIEAVESLNEYCRNKKIGFVYTAEFGLASFLFKDFGDNFIVEDLNGKECEKYFIKSITNSCPGVVEIEPLEIIENNKKVKKYLKLGTGDFVTFKDIKGMIEINDTPPRPIRILSKTKFTIEDTTKFQEFSGSGMVEEVKMSYPEIYRPFSESKQYIYNEDFIEEDFSDDIDLNISDENVFNIGNNGNVINNDKNNNINNEWIKMFYTSFQNEYSKNLNNEKIHLAILSLHEFFEQYQNLPKFNEEKDIDKCIEISLKILEKAKEEKQKWAINLEKIDKIFMKKIFKFSRLHFSPMACFFAGIVSQEILKFTGLYKPSNQWVYFSFLDLINDDIIEMENKNFILDDEFKKNIESYILFGKEKINELKNINILIIGLNDVGYEILRIFIMLGLLASNNNIIILDDNNYEINEKLNDLKNNDKTDNFNIIQEKIDLNCNLSEKEWWKNSTIIIDTLPFNKNQKEKLYIVKNCKKDNKILIDINTNESIGSYELILPEILIKKNKNKEPCFYEEDTPEGEIDNIKEYNNINIEKENELDSFDSLEEEEVNIKYKNIYTLEESINWSIDFLMKNFNIYIKHLNELINRSDSEEEMKKYIDDLILKENDNEKILKLIRIFKKLISLKLGMNFDSIVFHSIETFQELFEFSIDEILQKYPTDLIDQNTGKKFWSGIKIEPIRIKFDINNEEHYRLIYCMTYLFCQILEIGEIEQKMKMIKEIAKKYIPKNFDITILKKAKTIDFFNIEINSLIKFLGDIAKGNNLTFKEIEINYKENNEDFYDLKKVNKHLEIIILVSKIKLNNFGLSVTNRNNVISTILKLNDIHPATSSAISGLVVIQLFNMLNDTNFIHLIKSIQNMNEDKSKDNNIIINKNNDNISFYKNCIFNLSSNVFLLFDTINS